MHFNDRNGRNFLLLFYAITRGFWRQRIYIWETFRETALRVFHSQRGIQEMFIRG